MTTSVVATVSTNDFKSFDTVYSEIKADTCFEFMAMSGFFLPG